MKICVCQTDIVWENKSENMKKCDAALRNAAKNGADVAVFPELTLTGFSMDTYLAEPHDGETVNFFREISAKYAVSCIFGYALAEQARVFNNLAVASNGSIIGEYSKIHPFSYGGESAVYSAGSIPKIVDLSNTAFGLTVCYDLRFPELYQQLSKKSECIVVSANWPMQRRDHWVSLLCARAIENQCYIVACNRCGSGGGLDYSGDSMIVSPDGSCLARCDNSEMNIYADIDIENVHNLRHSFPVKTDRRIELYRSFYE